MRLSHWWQQKKRQGSDPKSGPGHRLRRQGANWKPDVEDLENRVLPIFLSVPTYPAGPLPSAVVVGDFNRDGKADLLVVNADKNRLGEYNTVSLLLGNGDGSFQAPRSISLGSSFKKDLVVGDFNGDGKLDLVGLSNDIFHPGIDVFLGNGDGTFGPPLFSPAGPFDYPTSLAMGDFDGDGKLDLVAVNQFNNVSVFLGNGNGTFRSPLDYPAGITFPALVAVGDFNGDGKPDIVVGNVVPPYGVSVLLNHGNGTFASARHYDISPGAIDVRSIGVASFNGHGMPDVVVSEFDGVFILPNLGDHTGTFGTVKKVDKIPAGISTYVRMADLRGNGKLDLVTAGNGELAVLLGNGDYTFQDPVIYDLNTEANSLTAMALGDWNGDGKPDLAIAGYRWTIIPESVETDSGVRILLGNGDGTFPANRVYITGSSTNVVVGDFSGSGRTDLAVAGLKGNMVTVTVLWGNGDGTFNPQVVAMYAGSNPLKLLVGDFSGDGKQDLAVVNKDTNDVDVLLNNGHGNWPVRRTANATGVQPQDAVAVDFDNDHKLDLIVVNDKEDKALSLFKGNGDGTFGVSTIQAINIHSPIVTADFNGDGNQDFAIPLCTDGVFVGFGDGHGGFGLPSICHGTATFLTTALVAADFSRRGRPDLVELGYNLPDNTGAVRVFRNNGDGTFPTNPTSVYPVGQGPFSERLFLKSSG